MKRESIFPLVVGVIAGALIIMFWQFNVRLNSITAGVNQLNQATVQNTKTVTEIVNFINGANKSADGSAAGTPSAK
jgi:hypothetical protein